MRISDNRLGRFLSVDPLTNEYSELTPYQFASNRPIEAIDIDGLEGWDLSNVKSNLATNAKLKQQVASFIKENVEYQKQIVTGRDSWGRTLTGPRNAVVAAIKQSIIDKINSPRSIQTAENIKNGIGGAAGYYINGDIGSDYGSVVDGVTQSFGGLDQKGFLSRPSENSIEREPKVFETESVPILSKPAAKRQAAVNKYGSNWAKGNLMSALAKFAGEIGGISSADGVKTRFNNTSTGIEIIVDNENNYFRIFDHNKQQYVGLDGKVPATGKLKGNDAKEFIQRQTHFKIDK